MNGAPFRILFVCMGNICRSPAADIVMHHLVKEENLTENIKIDSAGTIGYHTGAAPDDRMSETLASRGYKILGSARKIQVADFTAFDLILTMDDENFANVQLLDKKNQHSDKIKHFTDFCENHEDKEVPDPYYGGQKGFEHVADLVEDGCSNLLTWIKSKKL